MTGAAAALALALVSAGPAQAPAPELVPEPDALPAPAEEVPCGAYPRVVQWLAGELGMAPVSRRPAPGGRFLEGWANPLAGLWAVLVILPDGRACLAASGAATIAPGE